MIEGAIEGNFIVSGEYKVHEVSVNKEKFIYRLPFSVEITDNINLETLNFDICDFTYDVIGDDDLRVDIEFSIEAEEKPEVLPVEEEIDEPKIALEELVSEEEKEDLRTDEMTYAEEDLIATEERIDNVTQENIIKSIGSETDTYISYHIHIVREADTFESICAKYDVTLESIKQYNSVEEINLGDKLIIPNISYE